MISLQHIDKAFGNHQVLKDFSMDIKEHEFVSNYGTKRIRKNYNLKFNRTIGYS